MNLKYTPQAISDLKVIRTHIAEDSAVAADRVITRILQSMSTLETFPLIGRDGRIEDTREWVVSGLPYIGIYTLASDTDIKILNIIHTSQKYPPE